MTDTERLDYLEAVAEKGGCLGLINDDNGHWAVADSGMQNVPMTKARIDIATSFFVEAKHWRGTVRRALDSYMKANPL